MLHVDDLLRAYEAAIDKRAHVSGQAFNIGGGPGNTMSLLELLKYLSEELDKALSPIFSAPRPADQPVFVCNLAKAAQQLGWQPEIPVRRGVRELIAWVRDHKSLFEWLR